MDYKKIIRSRESRKRILQFFSFVPDRPMLKLQYYIKTGRKLNLKNPQRFTEKLQWYKLNCRSPLMQQCVNKYAVRDYVAQCGFENILVPLLGIYDTPDAINFDALPEQFVAKDTLGGGGNSVVVVKDKKQLNIDQLKAQMTMWINSVTSYKTGGREWPYGGQKHKVMLENYLHSDADSGGLIEYKFFCAYGEIKYVYVITDRILGKTAQLGIFTHDLKKKNVVRCDESPLTREVRKPEEYGEMCRIAEKLSSPFPESRIDLYNVDGNIYFGEITFFDGSGYMRFSPDEFDAEMGRMFPLSAEIRSDG